MLDYTDVGVVKQNFGVLQDSVDHVESLPVAFVGEVDQADFKADDVFWRKIWPGFNDRTDLLAEDVEELNVAGNAGTVLSGGEGRQSVNESRDDVLHVDTRLELGTRLQEAGQAGEVELVWEDLRQLRSVTESCCKLWQTSPV